MHKIKVFTLATFLSLSLAGCGDKDGDNIPDERQFSVTYKNVTVHGVVADSSKTASEKAKVETALKLAK